MYCLPNIGEQTDMVQKKVGKGRVGPNSVYQEVEVKTYSLDYCRDDKAVEDEKKVCGYFVLATNKPSSELPMEKALTSYKQEWQVERIFERLKGPFQVVPIYLQLPEHIVAMMYLLMTCAQVFTLMDREAKKTLVDNQEKLAGLFPNNIKTGSPKAEQMMDVFGNVGVVYMVRGDEISASVSLLTPLQAKILEITRVDPIGYNPDFVVPRLNCDYVKEIVMDKVQNAASLS